MFFFSNVRFPPCVAWPPRSETLAGGPPVSATRPTTMGCGASSPGRGKKYWAVPLYRPRILKRPWRKNLASHTFLQPKLRGLRLKRNPVFASRKFSIETPRQNREYITQVMFVIFQTCPAMYVGDPGCLVSVRFATDERAFMMDFWWWCVGTQCPTYEGLRLCLNAILRLAGPVILQIILFAHPH